MPQEYLLSEKQRYFKFLVRKIVSYYGVKMSEFFEKQPLSGSGKQLDFQVTLCRHFVSTNVDFAYAES